MAVIEQDLVRQAPAPMLMPMVNVTADAANRLSGMMREKELSGYALRVFVSGGGCSGLQYGMTFDDEMRDGDADFECYGLRVLVDPVSARYLRGANIEYSENLLGGGFKIDNPNAVSSCGCGTSFRANEDGGDEEQASGGCGSCGSH